MTINEEEIKRLRQIAERLPEKIWLEDLNWYDLDAVGCDVQAIGHAALALPALLDEIEELRKGLAIGLEIIDDLCNK